MLIVFFLWEIKMSSIELLEEFAALCHEQWSNWTIHFLNNCTCENRTRWLQQALKSYEDLSEADKEKDRKLAREFIKVVQRMKINLVGKTA